MRAARTTRAILAAAVTVVSVVLGTACSRTPSAGQVRGWNDELARLQSEQDSLRSRSAELIANDPGIQRLPKGEVVVAVPTAFVRDVIEHLFRDVVDHVTLSLSGIKAHVAKSVKKIVTIGEFTVDVEVTKVVGQLRPGKPTITFGGDRVSMSLPVSVSEGRGEAVIHFVWNGKNVADMTCGDMDITQRVAGNMIPSDYLVSGAMSLAMRGPQVIGTFHFPETRLRIRVKPSQASWDSIHAILAEKHGVCGWVLDKVDVPSLLANVVETKGFSVKLPLDKLKSVVLPAGLEDSVTVGGRMLAVAAHTNTLRIDADAIWYSATVRIEPNR
jgi:hypothetical protein